MVNTIDYTTVIMKNLEQFHTDKHSLELANGIIFKTSGNFFFDYMFLADYGICFDVSFQGLVRKRQSYVSNISRDLLYLTESSTELLNSQQNFQKESIITRNEKDLKTTENTHFITTVYELWIFTYCFNSGPQHYVLSSYTVGVKTKLSIKNLDSNLEIIRHCECTDNSKLLLSYTNQTF